MGRAVDFMVELLRKQAEKKGEKKNQRLEPGEKPI